MTASSLVCVIDANVAIKLFFNQPMSALADTLFTYLETDARTKFYVPDFFYAECASVFVKYVQIQKHPAETAKQDMEALKALSFDVVPTVELITDAVDIAVLHNISGYDACYVALSKQISAPLITADEKLVRAIISNIYALTSANLSVSAV